jgi:GT2 family glycosyltransferase
MLNANPLISIIALNYNKPDITSDFLRSVRASNTYSNVEMIIVDNGSMKDDTPAFLEIYPKAKIVRIEVNQGFAGGNNAGIRDAKGDYIFLVNNDTEWTPGMLEGLIEVFHQHPDAGAVCPKFHYFFEKGTIEYAGYNPINIFTGRNGMVGSKEKDNGQYDREASVTNYAHGGAMMVSRRVIDEVGAMPELFYLYYEELDWSEQIKRKGFKIYFQPRSLIYHKESMTTGKGSPQKTFYLTRNRILFMRRNVGWPALSVFMLYLVFFTIPKNTFVYLVKGQREHLRSFWKAILWQFDRRIRFA